MSDAHDTLERWLHHAAQSTNPGGKVRGAGRTLSEAFIADLLQAWETRGKDAIARVLNEKPDVYLRLVASLVSKDTEPKTDDFDDLGDAELAALIMAARAALKGRERTGISGDEKG